MRKKKITTTQNDDILREFEGHGAHLQTTHFFFSGTISVRRLGNLSTGNRFEYRSAWTWRMRAPDVSAFETILVHRSRRRLVTRECYVCVCPRARACVCARVRLLVGECVTRACACAYDAYVWTRPPPKWHAVKRPGGVFTYCDWARHRNSNVVLFLCCSHEKRFKSKVYYVENFPGYLVGSDFRSSSFITAELQSKKWFNCTTTCFDRKSDEEM